MNEIELYTGKSPLEAPSILWDNPLLVSIGQWSMSLTAFKGIQICKAVKLYIELALNNSVFVEE